MSFEEIRRKQLEQVIEKATDLEFKIQQQKIVALSPTQQASLELELENTKAHIKELEAEFEGLKGKGKPKGGPTCPKPPDAPLHFAGRNDELAELKQRVKADKLVALTSLNGQGGIGKTTLARKLAFDLYHETGPQKSFRAVLWGELTRDPDEGRLLEKLAQQADESFSRAANEDLETFSKRVKQTLQTAINSECEECGPNRVLLVLDDVWENGIEITRRVFEKVRPDNTTVLITSRTNTVAARLGVSQRDNQPLARLSPEAGAALLQEYLPDAPLADLLELATVLGGYTLALKIAATRLVIASNPNRALRLQTEQYRQKMLAGDGFAELELGADKEENLTAALSHSYAALTEVQQARFRAFGVLAHDQPFDLPMMMALWQTGMDETEEQAERFFQLALLEPAPETGEGWYKLHPVLQSYARALHKAALEIAIRRLYEACIVKITRQFVDLQPENWGVLTPYLPHVHAVGASLVEQAKADDAGEELLKLAQSFALNTRWYLTRRREVRQDEWLEMGLTISRRLQDQQEVALFLNELGALYSALGEKAKALEYYEQALPLERVVGDRGGEARALNDIGLVYRALGEMNKALEYYEQALHLYQAIGNRGWEATTLNNLGVIYRSLGEMPKALHYYEQALPLMRAVGDRGGEATTVHNIGTVYWALGNQAKALEYYEQALPIIRAVGDRNGEASTLSAMGLSYDALGEKTKALEYYEQALPLMRAVGDRFGEAITCFNMGMVYEELGQLEEAVRYVARCVELDEQTGRPGLEGKRATLARLRAKLQQSQSQG